MLSDQDLRKLQYSGEDADRLKVAKHYMAKGDLSSASSLLDQLCYNSRNAALKAEARLLHATLLLKQDLKPAQQGYYGPGNKFTRALERYELFFKETEVPLIKQLFLELGESYILLKTLAERPLKDSYSPEDGSVVQAALLLAKLHFEGRIFPKDLQKSFPYYQKAAQKKLAEALNALGDFYYIGHTPVSKDLAKAAQYFKQAVDEDRSGTAKYCYDYARACEFGEGLVIDKERAIDYYKRAVRSGHLNAHYRLGVLYAAKAEEAKKTGPTWQSDQYIREAIQYYEVAVKGNHQDAINGLGCLYDNQKKYATALKYFKKAAELGHAVGHYNVGIVYSRGVEGISKDESVPKNNAESVAWYRKAATSPCDYANAQYILGQKYETGDSEVKIERDLLQAFDWYSKAAVKDHLEAKKKLEEQKTVFYALKTRQIVGDRLSACITLQARLKHCFKDPLYLCDALSRQPAESFEEAPYQRLEFLGDRVLNLVIADFLEKKNPAAKVGELQNHYADMIGNRTVLPKVARDLNLETLIIKANTESGHEITDSMLSDALEALIGALYRDAGPAVAQQFVLAWWQPHLEDTLKQSELIKAKAKTALSTLPIQTVVSQPIKEQFTPRSSTLLSQFGTHTITATQFRKKVAETDPVVFVTQYGRRGDTVLHHILRKEDLTDPMEATVVEKVQALFFGDKSRLALRNKQGETIEELLQKRPQLAAKVKSTLK